MSTAPENATSPQAGDVVASLSSVDEVLSNSLTYPDVFLMMMLVSLANSHVMLSPLVWDFNFTG